jgi:integrase
MPSARASRRSSFGNIRKLPSKNYQATYVANGERISLGTFNTKTEAQNHLAMVQRDRYVGDWRDPSLGDVTLAQYIEDWIAASANKADSTLDHYSQMLSRWIDTKLVLRGRGGSARAIHLGSRAIASLTPRDIREWHSAVLEESLRRALDRHRRSMSSNATVNRAIRNWARLAGHEVAATGRIPGHLRRAWGEAGGPARLAAVAPDANAGRTEPSQAYRMLHAAMAQAVKDRIIRESPCDLDGAMQGDSRLRSEREVLSIPEIEALASHMPDRYQAAVWIASTCGLRSGELFALQRRHVDLVAGRLFVEQSLDRARRTTFSSTKTKAGVRAVDVPPSVLDRLERHMRSFTPVGPDSLVFGTSGGRPLSDSSRSKMMARARDAIRRPGITWHDLRHSAVTLTYEMNAPDAVALARHGHAGRRSALRYQHQRSGAGSMLAAEIDAHIVRELRAHS